MSVYMAGSFHPVFGTIDTVPTVPGAIQHKRLSVNRIVDEELIRTAERAMRYDMHLAVHRSNVNGFHVIHLISWLVTAPQRLVTGNGTYESDMLILLAALNTQHPSRYEDLAHPSRQLFG
ncbi:hypothetical protein [Deinococcus sonorensis]|uniref:Uncharacterized protein n=1 Tax=Deinococcus sonorensis TaxID=309891 RepID=A0ABV8YAW8_9DEIO